MNSEKELKKYDKVSKLIADKIIGNREDTELMDNLRLYIETESFKILESAYGSEPDIEPKLNKGDWVLRYYSQPTDMAWKISIITSLYTGKQGIKMATVIDLNGNKQNLSLGLLKKIETFTESYLELLDTDKMEYKLDDNGLGMYFISCTYESGGNNTYKPYDTIQEAVKNAFHIHVANKILERKINDG